jgi:magnesium chelatase subunit I
VFLQYFPNPTKLKKGQERDPYGVIKSWFAGGNMVDLLTDISDKEYKKAIDQVAGLKQMAETAKIPAKELYIFMELALHGLAEFDVLSKSFIQTRWVFKDHLTGALGDEEGEDDLRDLFN